jgi:hypothetical protein
MIALDDPARLSLPAPHLFVFDPLGIDKRQSLGHSLEEFRAVAG